MSDEARLAVYTKGVEIGQQVIDEIVRRILGASNPRRVILFGSAATGRMTRDSDIDLLIVEDSPGDTGDRSLDFYGALKGIGHPVEVIVMATERFEETKNVIGGIAFPANKYGKVIYESC